MEVEGVSKEEILQHLEQVPVRYFSHTGKEEVALHVDMVHRFEENGSDSEIPIISWRNDLRRSLTIVDIVTRDRQGIFEKVSGAFAVTGINILGARPSRGRTDWPSTPTPKTGRGRKDAKTRNRSKSAFIPLVEGNSPDDLISRNARKPIATDSLAMKSLRGQNPSLWTYTATYPWGE